MPQVYAMVVTAMGEVRDADGNLISSTPVESTITVTEAQLRDLGLDPEGEKL